MCVCVCVYVRERDVCLPEISAVDCCSHRLMCLRQPPALDSRVFTSPGLEGILVVDFETSSF